MRKFDEYLEDQNLNEFRASKEPLLDALEVLELPEEMMIEIEKDMPRVLTMFPWFPSLLSSMVKIARQKGGLGMLRRAETNPLMRRIERERERERELG